VGFEFAALSSLNLRMGRGESRKLEESIQFSCSLCAKRRRLGKDHDVLVRMSLLKECGEALDLQVCGTCMDILVESIKHGPRVIQESRSWPISSRVARVSLVPEELRCCYCMVKSKSRVYVKYDNLKTSGLKAKECSYEEMRACPRCVLSYMGLMKENETHKVAKPMVVVEAAQKCWKSVETVVD
jgi:hypothetical protein